MGSGRNKFMPRPLRTADIDEYLYAPIRTELEKQDETIRELRSEIKMLHSLNQGFENLVGQINAENRKIEDRLQVNDKRFQIICGALDLDFDVGIM